MKHPAYHLRMNKAVDRYALLEAIDRLGKVARLEEYTYYGLGGPYLEDFRLVHERFPRLKLVSIEEDDETLKRQAFHMPCRTLKLERSDFGSFLARYDAGDERVFSGWTTPATSIRKIIKLLPEKIDEKTTVYAVFAID